MRRDISVDCSAYNSPNHFYEDMGNLLGFSYISEPNMDELWEAVFNYIEPNITIRFYGYNSLLNLFGPSSPAIDELFKKAQNRDGLEIIFN